MGALSITLLGPPQLWLDRQPLAGTSRKLTLLLGYLLLESGQHAREDLAGLFWPDSEPEVARSALRTLLSQLRRLLPDRLHGEGPLVKLQLQPEDTVDVLQDGPAVSDLPFLHGVEVGEEGELTDWLRAMRTHLQVQQRTHLQQATKRSEAQGKPAEALNLAERWFNLDRTDEDATQTLMTLAHRLGDTAQIQGTYERHRHALAQQVDAQPSVRTQTLLTQLQVERSPDAAGPERSASPERRAFYRFPALPVRIRSFVGRQTELTQMHRLLDDGARLLTLLGMGGIGKTRLALELAASLGGQYPDRVAFVPLEGLQDPRELPRAILTTLGQDVSGTGDLLQQLIQLVNVRPSVLVLDNFEHLMEGVDTVEALLTACPELRVIVTSREALNLQHEHRFSVLGLQQTVQAEDPEAPLPSEAVQLWVQRARQVRPDFQLNDATRSHVEQLCRLVGGAPLGIELAAAWLKVLTLEDLAHDLSLDLDLAASTARDVPARQQSLRTVFEYSWRRLTLQEQRALAGLSVFRGGFTREAAREVVGVSIQRLSRLVDTSLLQMDPSGRFDRHPLVYQYTQEKLEASGDAEHFRTRHATYFVQLAAESHPHLTAPSEDRWLDMLDQEQQNFSVALEHLKRSGERQTLLGFCADLAQFWANRGHDVFGRSQLQAAIRTAEDATGTLEYARAQCLLCVSIADGWIPTAVERTWLREGIEGCRRWGDQRTLAVALRTQAYFLETPTEEAHLMVQEARQLYEGLDDQAGIISVVNMQGLIAMRGGQSLSAQWYFEQCLSLAERHQIPYVAAQVNLGGLHVQQHAYLQAVPLFEASMRAFQRKKNWAALGRAMNMLSSAHFGLGQLDEAKRLLHESLSISRSVGQRESATAALLNLTSLAISEHQLNAAEELLQEAHQEAGAGWIWPEVTLTFRGMMEQQRGDLLRARRSYLQVLSQPCSPYATPSWMTALEAYLTLPLDTVAPEELARLLGSLPTARAALFAVFTPRYRAELAAGQASTARRAHEALGNERFELLMRSSGALPFPEVQDVIQRHAMTQLTLVESD
ncbi:AfsR/SARP family transcriptional regulator [Deinococcus sonorensis]|uniref:Tetratricopeptide repeat protein n=2 Tax=Deinococcus sonorensis TaxID=309891 RepID=A0AAU7U6H9_9DEIO